MKSDDKLKHISTSTMLMTKLDTDVTYHEGIPPINSHCPWIRWSFEIYSEKLPSLKSISKLKSIVKTN